MRNLVKGLLSGWIVSMMFYSEVFAACPSGFTRDSASGLCSKSACAGNCTYYYNDTTYDFEAKVNPGVAPGTPVLMDGEMSMAMHNATIGEGITGFAKSYVFFNMSAPSSGRGTMTYPSTFDDPAFHEGTHTGNFAIYDLSAMKNAHLNISSSSSYSVILSDDAHLNIRERCPYSSCVSGKEINLVCKGNQADCRSQLKSFSVSPTTSYYTGLDEDGNWEVWSDNGKAVYADSSMQKLLSKYDFDGNQTGLYKYDRGGNLIKAMENGVEVYRRRIYTPAEATVAVSGKNTFKLKYR